MDWKKVIGGQVLSGIDGIDGVDGVILLSYKSITETDFGGYGGNVQDHLQNNCSLSFFVNYLSLFWVGRVLTENFGEGLCAG